MTERLIGATFCSGIGTPELACPDIDWRFASEIEKFPRAVLQYRFGMEDVRSGVSVDGHALWGDLTTVRIRHFQRLGIPLPNVIVAGLPCQAFSIAGLRKSLSDDRGNLTLRFLRLLHGFRTAGSLRNFVFENVPGILSAADNPFGCLLAGLVGADDPLCVPGGGSWPNEGMVEGPLGRAAWRVLDAQHFGLAQRRKRVFVVYDTGTGADPSTVLFERQSVHGYHPSRREERQAVAPTISARTKGGGGLGTDFDLDGGLTAVPMEQVAFGGGNTSDEPRGGYAALTAKGQRIDFEVETFVVSGHGDYRQGNPPTLRASGGDSQGGSEALVKAFAIQERAVSENPDSGPDGKGVSPELAYTLEARSSVQGVVHSLLGQKTTHALTGEGFDASEDGTGRGTLIVPVPPTVYSIMPQNSGKDYKAREVEVAQPVMAGGPVGGNQGGDYVVDQPIPINLQVATRHNALGRGTGFGVGEPGEPSSTISSAHSHGVAVPHGSKEPYTLAVRGRDGEPDIEYRRDGTANAVLTPNGGRAGIGVGAIAFSSKDHGADAMKELSPTLRAGGHSESHANAGVPPAIAFNARQDTIHSIEVTQPLDTDGGTVGDTDSGWRVRRLTVVECEKLQGLPINHTLIPWRGNRQEPDFSETVRWLMSHGLDEAEAISLAGVPDGPRYKAIGNGMALDVVEWILNRVVEFMPENRIGD